MAPVTAPIERLRSLESGRLLPKFGRPGMVAVDADSRHAAEVLARVRRMIDPAMVDAVGALPSSMRRIAGYHLGWWDAQGTAVQGDRGKAIRPALAILSAEATGGTALAAVPAAVSVELLHNSSLLHDDVMDRDDMRRHHLAAWRVFGHRNAILAGDALLAQAFQVLLAGGGRPCEGTARFLGPTVQLLIEGQHADLEYEQGTGLWLADCVRMAERKTAALLRCACALGAIAGGGTGAQVQDLAMFGSHLGLAYQVVDDIHGIWGDPMRTGKAADSDLRNRKKSIPVVAALTSGTRAAGELARWYEHDSAPTAVELTRAASLIDEAGGRSWSLKLIETLQSECLRLLASVASPVSPALPLSQARAVAELKAMVDYVTRR